MIERDEWKKQAKVLSMSSSDTSAEQKVAWDNYKKYRNKINNRKKREEILFKSEKMQQAMNSPDTLWKTAKGFMGWKSTGSPTQLQIDNKLVTSAHEMAQAMNYFFVGKIENIRATLPPVELNTIKIRENMQNKNCQLHLKDITVSDVKKLLWSLSNSKSTSLDGLNNYSVKLAAHYIAQPMHHVIRLSIIQQKFPRSWKFSKVIPLHKRGDPLDRKNYRPVALLSPLSKVMEKIVYRQIYEYFSINGLFHKSLHGYRKFRSTQTALLQLYDRWVRSASDGKLSGAVLLDLSAAFDLVDSRLLIEKLKLYRVGNPTISWLESYLTNRQQAVWIDNAFSDFLPCEVGVPQGSNLGPLLFLIFFNDLPSCLSCDFEAFADDSTLSVSGINVADISQKLTENCRAVSDWMIMNKLKLNATKTHVMALGTDRRLQLHGNGLSVEMDGVILSESETKFELLLGCYVEPCLKWHKHTQELLKKLKARLGALATLKDILPVNSKKSLAEGIFISLLCYCLPLYGGCDKKSIESL